MTRIGMAAAKVNADATQRLWRQYAALLTQLTLLTLVVYAFKIENEAFARLTFLTVTGFGIHYLLPFHRRLPFFVLLSLGGIVLVLGAVHGVWVIGLGFAILGIAHLPVSFQWRVALLLSVGLGLAVFRWGVGQVPWSPAIWPILGSLFVFRLFSYLYDIQHGVKPSSVWQVVGYFFLLPNVCFPLFPVVDFKRFGRGYYDSDRHVIYQVGVEWIWRGLIQLLIYRLVYFQLTLDPVEVSNVADLAVYMLSTFLLYVRLSGYFHIVIGMLHLFGFNLPETHHRYFLASSFTDFWRRINMYWKDFMMKSFYYPAFFRCRKYGDTTALVLATLFTFAVTWFLHLVQWFWIRGSVLVEWNDIIFWSLFALLLLINALYEARHGRERAIGAKARTLRASIGVMLRTLATFTTICVMWSFWSAESVTDWWLMVADAMHLPPWNVWQWVTLLAVVAFALAAWTVSLWQSADAPSPALEPTVTSTRIIATSLSLLAITSPLAAGLMGTNGEVLSSLRLASASALNRRDAENFQRGYYERLVDVSKFNSELWTRYQQMPTDFVRSLDQLGLSRFTNDEQDYELAPLKEGRFVGATVKTNRWGMRDKDYSLERRADTVRIALIGPSTAMGSGVPEAQSFASLVEDKLNQDSPPMTFEILNFGVAGYTPLHMLFQLDRKVFQFSPDTVLYLAHANDIERTSRQLTKLIRRNAVPRGSYLEQVVQATGIVETTGSTEARRRMKPFEEKLLGWVYSEVVRKVNARGALPVLVYMETVTEPTEPWRSADRRLVLSLAQRAGFTVLDLTGAYAAHAPSELWIADNDGHPNELGSRLIADRLYSLMRTLPPVPQATPGGVGHGIDRVSATLP